MVCMLLDVEADPHALNETGHCCAFHLAIETGQRLRGERMLAKTNAGELERKEWLARTQVMAAAANVAEMRALFRQDGFGILLDQETLQAVMWGAMWEENVEVARFIIEAGADVNLGRPKHFRNWWMERHNGCRRMATKYGYGNFPLEKAVSSEWHAGTEIVELLLGAGALTGPFILQRQGLPLEIAVRGDKIDYVKVLIDRGARIDGTDYVLASGPSDVFLGSLLDMG